MGISIPTVAVISSLHIFAFLLAVGAEMRRSTGVVVPDEYDERTYCLYDSDASTTYGLSAFAAMLVGQAAVGVATGCFCFGGAGITGRGGSRKCAIASFVVSWLSFIAAEACLLAGSVRNAYHTKYMGYFLKRDLSSCAAVRQGIFAAAAGLVLVSMVASLIFYWTHSKAEAGGWVRHRNEGGVGMTDYGLDGGEHQSSKA